MAVRPRSSRRGWTRTSAAVAAAAALCLSPASATQPSTGESWTSLATTIFRNVTHENGLPGASEPTAFAQDGRGYVWIGSQDGLMRWDGYRVRKYVGDPRAPGALADSFVVTLHTDAAGRLWVGSNVAGLSRYDEGSDQFVAYQEGGLRGASVAAIADDGRRGLWIGGDHGLDHLDTTSGRVFHAAVDRDRRGDSSTRAVGSLLRDRAGALWVGTTRGLFRRPPGAADFVAVPLAAGGRAVAPTSLLQADDGRIWVGTSRDGAYVVAPDATHARAVHETGGAPSSLATQAVSSIAQVSPGLVWLGTAGQGLLAVDTTSMHTRRIRHDPEIPSSLEDDTVLSVARDHAGLVWVATNSGFSIYNPRHTAFVTLSGARAGGSGLEDPEIRSVAVMPDGRTWLGLGSAGVDVFDPTRGRVARLRPNGRDTAHALPAAPVRTIVATPGGAVYLGGARGLYRSTLAATSVARVAIPGQDPGQNVGAMLYDRGLLWVGQGGLRAIALDPEGLPAGKALEIQGALTDLRIAALAAAPDGGLWIGTHNGLDRLDRQHRVVETILPDARDAEALAPGGVTSLLIDHSGRLWAASTGGGVDILTRRDAHGRPRFHHLGTSDGLPNANVDKLLQTARGVIWASTDDGLARIDPATLRVTAMGKPEGVSVSNYWSGSGGTSPEGNLLFGGVGGLTVVRPDRLEPWTFSPPVVATEIEIGGAPAPAGRDPSGRPALLTIRPRADSLSVEFAALDYSSPELNRYAHQLVGYDRDWIETDVNRRVASYTNLAPGRYTLRLRGSNHAGVWAARSLDIPVEVLAAWYQTVWFRAGAVVAVLALAALLLHTRTAYLRRLQHDLERVVVERTRELRESQRELENMAYHDPLTGLANRRSFAEACRRFIAASLRSGQGFALLLIDLDRFKEINDTLGHDAGDALLVETAARLQSVLRETDHLARLGGDEFAILLSEIVDAPGVEPVCRRILEIFVAPTLFRDQTMQITPSVGVALFPDGGDTEGGLYKSADLALYAAKRAGRNTWRIYGSAAEGAIGEPPRAEAFVTADGGPS